MHNPGINYDAPEGLPFIIADLEQLSRDLTSLAVDEKHGRILDMSGFLDHEIEHLHEIREALGYPQAMLTVNDVTGDE
jgi:hypothetical protein